MRDETKYLSSFTYTLSTFIRGNIHAVFLLWISAISVDANHLSFVFWTRVRHEQSLNLSYNFAWSWKKRNETFLLRLFPRHGKSNNRSPPIRFFTSLARLETLFPSFRLCFAPTSDFHLLNWWIERPRDDHSRCCSPCWQESKRFLPFPSYSSWLKYFHPTF